VERFGWSFQSHNEINGLMSHTPPTELLCTARKRQKIFCFQALNSLWYPAALPLRYKNASFFNGLNGKCICASVTKT
jgi:hypothetical protein